MIRRSVLAISTVVLSFSGRDRSFFSAISPKPLRLALKFFELDVTYYVRIFCGATRTS
jgi:hypothetical protein